MKKQMKEMLEKITNRIAPLTMDDVSEKEIALIVELHRADKVKYTHDNARRKTFVWPVTKARGVK